MENELQAFEKQLVLVQQQISTSANEEERTSLIELETSIKELINLTRDNAIKSEANMEEQYSLFQAELELEDNKIDGLAKENSNKEAIQNDLNSLEGMKCQAPFWHAWSEHTIFHNAIVFTVNKTDDIISTEDVKLTVMFTHPTQLDMKPCPYFLDGNCRFTSEKCKFSHGEEVTLENLKEFKDPDFTGLVPGSRILVKQPDGLWNYATLGSLESDKCLVKLDASSREFETDIINLFPLDNDVNMNDVLSVDSEEEGVSGERCSLDMPTQMPHSNLLGSWEQFTTGFGSRIMAKMGYKQGSGLGAKAEGRVEPVPAIVYPPRKSLDHCMMLKEQAGDENLFSTERKIMRKKERKERKQLKYDNLSRAYERDKTDVFTFLNNSVGSMTGTRASASLSPQTTLEKVSQKGLAINSFQIAKNMTQLKKEKTKLVEALMRHSSNTRTLTALKEQIKACDVKLLECQESERKISEELKQRDNRKKLSVF